MEGSVGIIPDFVSNGEIKSYGLFGGVKVFLDFFPGIISDASVVTVNDGRRAQIEKVFLVHPVSSCP